MNISNLGIGDWGLGIGDWELGKIRNPPSPIRNPQCPWLKFHNHNLQYLKWGDLMAK